MSSRDTFYSAAAAARFSVNQALAVLNDRELYPPATKWTRKIGFKVPMAARCWAVVFDRDGA
jgi:hypothetical protein